MKKRSKRGQRKENNLDKVKESRRESVIDRFGRVICEICNTNQGHIAYCHYVGRAQRSDLIDHPDNGCYACHPCHKRVEARDLDGMIIKEEISAFILLHDKKSLVLRSLPEDIKKIYNE